LFLQSILPVALLLYAGYHITIRLIGRARTESTSQLEPAWPSMRWWLTPPVAAQAAALFGICLLIVGFAPHKAVPFIYFQF
jgi:hypothetical protein